MTVGVGKIVRAWRGVAPFKAARFVIVLCQMPVSQSQSPVCHLSEHYLLRSSVENLTCSLTCCCLYRVCVYQSVRITLLVSVSCRIEMDKFLVRSTCSSSKKQRTLSPEQEKPIAAGTDAEQPSCSSTSTPLLRTCENKKKSGKRKYDEKYLSFGFTYTGNFSEPVPQCVICLETLSNHSMKPSLLLRHFNTKHINLINKPLEFFKRKESELKVNKGAITSFTGLNTRAVEASYKVSLRIAQELKPHTIGETLILPAAKDLVSTIIGDKEGKQLDVVSLSDNTVSRRISNMALNVKDILLKKVNSSKYFAIQVDETTDVANLAQLLCYVRYEEKYSVGEDMLFCETLSAHTTGEDIFYKVNEFVLRNGMDWKKCVGICTDGARAMTGAHSGLVTKIKKEAPEAQHIHCSLHREALVTKRCPAQLKTVLNEAVKTVNFIKSRALNSRLFRNLCQEMDSIHKQLLLHTEVRWLSRGKMLTRVFELRHEILIFLTDSDFELRSRFTDELWLCRLAYLADIFSKLNDVNMSFQGTSNTPFRVCDKINALKQKITFADDEAKKSKVSFFPSLSTFVEENELSLSKTVLSDISDHCNILKENLSIYFPENYKEHLWMKTPFSDIKKMTIPENLSLAEKDQLFDLNCDSDLKEVFDKATLIDFWIQRRQDYGEIANRAVKFLLPFSTSYLCEAAFSSLCYLKNKYRNRLACVENDLRLKLSPIKPDIATLSKSLQAHPSH